MKELIRTQNYSLYEDKNGALWIEVLCGTIWEYEIKVKMLPDEVETYKKDPDSINDLAYKISRAPKSYEKRRFPKVTGGGPKLK